MRANAIASRSSTLKLRFNLPLDPELIHLCKCIRVLDFELLPRS